MAKKNKVFIEIEINGKMQKVAVDAKKLGKELDNVEKGARNADRNLKGAAQASSNSTKNFAKLTQGTNGLVAAYATLAAQLFAISAAYNFLKNAADLRVLQEGQLAYASATGIAMKTLSNRIIEATSSMITFQDASQAAAIGVAAGLSPDQLTRLGAAAKSASMILGRDVTDSFNRLIRGATKAEPELLDELGIILRLQKAGDDYARTIGKNGVEALTAFERTQAVTNDVLTQAEEKYGKILAITAVAPNNIAQLGKAFDDIINKIKLFADSAVKPLTNLLTEMPLLAGAAIVGMLRPVLTAAIPGLQGLVGNMENVAASAQKNFEAATKEVNDYKKAVIAAAKDPKARAALGAEAQKGLLGGLSGVSAKKGSVLDRLRGGEELNNRQLGALKRQLRGARGEFGAHLNKQRKALLNNLDDMMLANSAATKKMTADYETMSRSSSRHFLNLKAKGSRAIAGLATFTSRAVGIMNKAFMAVGVIGMIASLGMLITGMIKGRDQTEKVEDKTTDLTKSLRGANEEMRNFVAIQKVMNADGRSTEKTIMALANQLNNLSVDEYANLQNKLGDQIAGLREMENAEKVLNRMQSAKRFGSTSSSHIANRAKNQENEKDLRAQKERVRLLQQQYKGTDAEAYVKRLRDIREALLLETDEKIRNSTQGKHLLDVINRTIDGEKHLGTVLAQAVSGYMQLGDAISESTKARIENETIGKDLRKKLYPQTEIEAYLASLRSQMELEKDILDSKGTDQELQKQRIKNLQREIDLMDDRANMALRHRRAAQAAELGFAEGGSLAPIALFENRRKEQFQIDEMKRKRDQAQESLNMQQADLPVGPLSAEVQRGIDDATHKIKMQTVAIKRAEFAFSDMGQIAMSVTDSIGGAFTNAFAGIISGTMSTKEAFSSMASSILGSIVQIIAKMMAMQALKFLFPGGLFGMPFRNGGIMDQGKKVSGYAGGGVASGSTSGYPAVLHGTEAVVPLPDGKNIPVEMTGGGSQVNNVVVNISSEGQTNTEGSQGSLDMENLGKAVGEAVQAELHAQKRAGGILSPYGVA